MESKALEIGHCSEEKKVYFIWPMHLFYFFWNCWRT